jgi:two-component sensor histidine kinase/Tfp pilus assembly major pilin PilA
MKTVRARLLGVMTLVVIPVAAGIGVISYTGYVADERAIRAVQMTAADGRAQTIEAWLDTVGRSLVDQSVGAAFLDAGRCAEFARTFVGRNSDYAAVRLVDAAGAACAAGEPIDPSQIPPAPASSPESGAGFRLAVVGNRLWVATTGAGGASTPEPNGVLVLKREAVISRLSALATIGETHMALMAAGTALFSQSEAGGSAPWLPTAIAGTDAGANWVGRDQGGREAAFVITPTFGPDLSVLARFDEQPLVDAWRRVVALCLAPLALLVLLSLAYANSIQRDVVHWIKGIEIAARKRSRDPESRAAAPVHPGMPSELRSVALAVNAMAEHTGQRQRALQTSLAENRALMQEMHHRVKNSLQVIQSYVALIRRMEKGVDSVALTRISGGVSVLAVAYRIALTSGGIRPVSVKPFLDEVATALFASLRRPYQKATAVFEWEGELDVDRAIPLGLGMVEAIIAGIDGARATFVAVRLCPTGQGEVELIVCADGARAAEQPSDKIMIGLAGQLGATPEQRTTGEILAWRFAP